GRSAPGIGGGPPFIGLPRRTMNHVVGCNVTRLVVRGRLLLGNELAPGAVLIENHRIAEIRREPSEIPSPDRVLQAEIVAPGFVDLQVNGGFGCEVGEDPDALRQLAARLPSTGVTAFLPTA